MTIALLGVGADTTNSAPTPPVYPDGTFEYIPIPEASGPDGTSETKTYGTTLLNHRRGTLADYLQSIRPQPPDGPTLTGEELASWPLHHDPNFEALTYGETTSRAAYTGRMRRLREGDLVAFYTGLRSEQSRYRDRYLIGYFTVREVIDFQRLDLDGEATGFSSLSAAEQEAAMARIPDNAHAKRFQATGRITANDGLVVLTGKQPGGLLPQAFPISEHAGGGHHYLPDELEAAFRPAASGNPNRNAHLGGIKPAHLLDVAPETFLDIIE